MEPTSQPADIDRFVRMIASDDRLSAALRIEQGCPPTTLTIESLGAFLDAQAVGQSVRDAAALTGLIDACKAEPDEPHEAVVAKGTPPVAGDDSEFIFAGPIEQQRERIALRAEALKQQDAEDASADPTPADDSSSGVDFYNQSAFVIALPGEVIGRFTPKTDGIDGSDIYNGVIPATSGRDCPVRTDQTVRTNDAGEAVAIAGGLVELADNRLRAEPTLRVHDAVSFATGNIDFPGDVIISKGVRDRFVVRAAGDVTIAELVEAAAINCEQSLTLNGGMAGRSTGSIRTGRDLHAHYLDAISGLVIGSAVIDREITNCDLLVEGMLEARSCMIRGGSLTVARRVEIAGLGSTASTPTQLIIGSMPQLARLAADAIGLLNEIDQSSTTGNSELDALRALPKRTAEQIEQLMELEFASDNSGGLRLKLRVAIDRIIESMRTSTVVSLTVHTAIYAGATLTMPGWRADFEKNLPGPVLIELDETRTPVFGNPKTSDRRPLAQASRCRPDDTVPVVGELLRGLDQSDEKQAA